MLIIDIIKEIIESHELKETLLLLRSQIIALLHKTDSKIVIRNSEDNLIDLEVHKAFFNNKINKYKFK